MQCRWTVCMWRSTSRTKKADKIYSVAGRVSLVAARSKPDNLISNMYRWVKKIGGRGREKYWGHSNPCYFIFLVLLPALVIYVVLRHLSWVSGWLRAAGERVRVFIFWCSSPTRVFQQNCSRMFPCGCALSCVSVPVALIVLQRHCDWLWLAPSRLRRKVLWTDKRGETWLMVDYWKYLKVGISHRMSYAECRKPCGFFA